MPENGPRYLFLLGTMRSGSSLLASILCSHPEILGYGETHLVYDGPEKVRELVERVSRAHGGRRPVRYVFDKLLHNGLICDPRILAGGDLTCVFLLREPRRTIASLVHQFRLPLDDAFTYYRDRLLHLERYAQVSPGSAFVTYEGLIADPAGTLERLTRFLGLASPLSPEYRLQPLQDAEGVGDPSGRLATGRILTEAREIRVALPEERVAEAEEAWRRCRAELTERTLAI